MRTAGLHRSIVQTPPLAHLVVIPLPSVTDGKDEFTRERKAVTQKKSAVRGTASFEKSLGLLPRDSPMIPSFLERIHHSCRPSSKNTTKKHKNGNSDSGSHIAVGSTPPTGGVVTHTLTVAEREQDEGE